MTEQLQPGTLLDNGKYRVERWLGKGAFGEVYLARQVKLNGLRAIKVVRLDESDVSASVFEEYRKRFDKENRLAEKVRRHPNVIQVDDVFGDDDFQAAVMEYAPGGSLADLLAREGRQPEDRVRRIIADVARGLQALHEQWAIHRDVKPANILLAEDGTAKVADFGLAQWEEANTSVGPSVPGSLINIPHPGTPNYMSPEHSSPKSLTQTADVYSLGCVAFELLTGQPWVFASSQVDSARELRPEVSAEFDAVVMRMLCDTPGLRKADRGDVGKRFVDMGDVLEAMGHSQIVGIQGGGFRAAGPPLRLFTTEQREPDSKDLTMAACVEAQISTATVGADAVSSIASPPAQREQSLQRASSDNRQGVLPQLNQHKGSQESVTQTRLDTPKRDHLKIQLKARSTFLTLCAVLGAMALGGTVLLTLARSRSPWILESINYLHDGLQSSTSGDEQCGITFGDVLITEGHTMTCSVVVIGGSSLVEAGATVNGNLRVMPGSLRVLGVVNGNLSAWRDVAIEGDVSGDVLAIQGDIQIESRVGGSVTASSGDVYLLPGSFVHGPVSATGTVSLAANTRIEGDLTVIGHFVQDPNSSVSGTLSNEVSH